MASEAIEHLGELENLASQLQNDNNTTYLMYALRLCGISIDKNTTMFIERCYKLVTETNGKCTLQDVEQLRKDFEMEINSNNDSNN